MKILINKKGSISFIEVISSLGLATILTLGVSHKYADLIKTMLPGDEEVFQKMITETHWKEVNGRIIEQSQTVTYEK